MSHPRRRLALLALLATACAACLQADGVASVATPAVVIVKKGVTGGDASSGYAEYGVVLRNTSATKDALGVMVTVKATDARGRALTSDSQRVTFIPAGATFVVAGALTWGVNLAMDRTPTAVRVTKFAPKGRKLPPVKRITLDDLANATVTFTNPYRKPLPPSATVGGVFLDAREHIISGSSGPIDATVRAGATVSVDFTPNVQTVEQLESIEKLVATVDPCGDPMLRTTVCPFEK
jgi:hypothetical protein